MPNREMLVNYVQGEECRIAIIEDGRLEELYQERASNEMHVGNIYKGRVINVEPSIQAAFIDFGLERNGFLHISDLHPKYFPGEDREETEQVGLKTPRRDRPPIQRCLRRGQEILVQVLKEGIGTKGPTLTSYLSIPGRFLVMMPDMERMGVSRKVDDDDARRNMRAILDNLKPPKGFGFIIRTAGIGRNKHDLQRDLAYLQRLWKTLEKRMAITDIGELFAESDLIIRTMRDVYSADITRVIIDDASAAQRARDFLSISNPRAGSNVLVYKDTIPIFHRFGIEEQIEHINSRTVPLPSGGSLVIDTTEALVAIDVNSGKHRENRDAEMTAYKVNLEAVDEICRQLRLRDLGGVIVNDLIDMRDLKHRRDIENRFRDNLKNDRARTRIGPISQFGVLEMTRQRMRPSHTKSLFHDCPACQGTGMSRSAESMVLSVIRHISLVLQRPSISRVEVTVSPDVAFQLLNRKRAQLVAMEQANDKTVTVRVFGDGGMSYLGIAGFDARGATVDVQSAFLLAEPTLEQVPGILDDSDLGDIVDETLIEETVPNEAVGDENADVTTQTIDGVSEHVAGVTADNMAEQTDGSSPDSTDGEIARPDVSSVSDPRAFQADDLPAEALSMDDPLAAARSLYRDGEEDVEAPDEHTARPGFHGPRVVVPAPVPASLVTHAHAPVPPYRQQQRPPAAPQGRPQNAPYNAQNRQQGNQQNQPRPFNNQNNNQQNNAQNPQQPQGEFGNQVDGEGRNGRRRRRRRRGRGGGQGQFPQQPGQPGQLGQQQGQPQFQQRGPQASDQQGDQTDSTLDDHDEQFEVPVTGEQSPQRDANAPDATSMEDGAVEASNVAAERSGPPTDAELDELADSIGNLKSPELIELARRRLAAAQGQQNQQGQPGFNQQGVEGDGNGGRRRRRRRGRGGRGGGAYQGDQQGQPSNSGPQDQPQQDGGYDDGADDGGADAHFEQPSVNEQQEQAPTQQAELFTAPVVETPAVQSVIEAILAPTSAPVPPVAPTVIETPSPTPAPEPAPEAAPVEEPVVGGKKSKVKKVKEPKAPRKPTKKALAAAAAAAVAAAEAAALAAASAPVIEVAPVPAPAPAPVAATPAPVAPVTPPPAPPVAPPVAPAAPAAAAVPDLVAARLAALFPVKPTAAAERSTVKREPVPDLVAERMAAVLSSGPIRSPERPAPARGNPPAAAPADRPATARVPVPDLVAERLAAMGPLQPLGAKPNRAPAAPAAQRPAPPAAVAPRATPPVAPVPAAPIARPPVARPPVVTPIAKPPAPVAPATPIAPPVPAPKRPLPPAVPLFAPTEAPAASAPAAPPSVDPVNPIKGRSPIVRPPYRRKKAAPDSAPETTKPEA